MMHGNSIPEATMVEVQTAIKSINKQKAEDYYNIAIEHILNAGSNVQELIHKIINEIFKEGHVPNGLKIGLLSPVYKNKGLNGRSDLPWYYSITSTMQNNRNYLA